MIQGLKKPFSKELYNKFDGPGCGAVIKYLLRVGQGNIKNLGRCFSLKMPDIHYDLNFDGHFETKYIEVQVSDFWTEEWNPEAWAKQMFPREWCGVLERKLCHTRIHGPKVKYYNLSKDLSRAWVMPGDVVAKTEKELGLVPMPNKLHPNEKGIHVSLKGCFCVLL